MMKNEEGKLTKGYSNFHFKYSLWSFDIIDENRKSDNNMTPKYPQRFIVFTC